MTARPQLVEDLDREGIPAAIEQLPGGLWRAALHRRDGSLAVEHIACPDAAAAEAWLLVCAAERYPNCLAVRAARGRAA